jgi:DNA-binding transcriptional MerR regulator
VDVDAEALPEDAHPDGRYRIGQLARLAGPAASTLRTWQDRYPGLLRPERSPGGHRLYDGEDLAAVREMQRLVAGGATVAAAAAGVVARRDAGRRAAGPTPSPASPPLERTWWASSAEEELAARRAAHDATRTMLHASAPSQVAAALRRFVVAVGGEVGAGEAGPDALPVDLSLGAGPPTFARAPAGSAARRQLSALLPGLVDDARVAASGLRTRRRRTGRSTPGAPG